MPSLSSSHLPPRWFQRYLAPLAAALLVLGGHFWMIDRAGSPVPLHDQWHAEAEMLYLPAVENRVTLHRIFHPHAEHTIVPTRLLALGLFQLNDKRWDVRLQMTVNSFLAAALAALIARIAARQLGRRSLVLFAAALGGLLASPLFYGNTLWGFQSQFYFLLLFSVLHLDLVLRQRIFSAAWSAGVLCSVLACVSMGSGFFSALVVTLITGWISVRRQLDEERRSARLNLVVHAVIAAAAILLSPAQLSAPPDLAATVHILVHCLSWPGRFFTPWGAWVWIPFLLFAGTCLRHKTPSSADRVLLALGLWVLAQIAAISVARSTPSIVITPRYYEILWLGLTANTLALHRLWQLFADARPSRRTQTILMILAVAWIAPVSWKAGVFTEGHWRNDLAVVKGFADSQTDRVRAFLANDDLNGLKAVPYPKIPHPDPDYLAGLLRNATVRSFLPAELTDVPVPVLSLWTHLIRGSANVLIVLGLTLLLIELWLSLRRRFRSIA